MKKLRLKALSLGAREILNREQLRSITGGCADDSDCGGWACVNGWCDQHGQPGGSGSGSGGSGGACQNYYAICGNCGCMLPSDCTAMGGCA